MWQTACSTSLTGTLPAQQFHQHPHLITKPQGKSLFLVLDFLCLYILLVFSLATKCTMTLLSLLLVGGGGVLKDGNTFLTRAFLSKPTMTETICMWGNSHFSIVYCISFMASIGRLASILCCVAVIFTSTAWFNTSATWMMHTPLFGSPLGHVIGSYYEEIACVWFDSMGLTLLSLER